MRASSSIAVLTFCLGAALGCTDATISTGLACNDDASCDPSDLCLSGGCHAEGSGQTGSVGGFIVAAPASQSIAATVGVVPAPVSVTVTDEEAIAHALTVSCSDGAAPAPVSKQLGASASFTVTVALPAPSANGSSTITCAVTSTSGATTWATFAIQVNATGGGSGGGAAGGAGGGSAGGSGGGTAGGSGGGHAGGSGGGAAGGSGGGSGGGAGGGTAGGSGGGAAGGAGGGSAGGSGGGHAGGSGGGAAGGAAGGSGGGTAGGSGGGAAGGAGGGSGGSTGSVGATGGAVDHLYFAVIGDSRPGNLDDTANYPTAIITKIYQDIQAMSPRPQFVITTGDYMYANTSANTAQPQANLYMSARAAYAGTQFPVLGNHEFNGYTASNCIPPPHTPPANCTNRTNCACNTQNYSAYANTILKPIGQTLPYYSIPITALDNSWTAKLIFVACNAWDDTQSQWLTSTLAQATTYTILARHESATASPAGPCQSAAETIMGAAKYNLSLVGHAHEFYGKASSKEVTVGNGGAPLASSYATHGTFGYTTVEKLASGWQIKNYDYSTSLPVTTYIVP